MANLAFKGSFFDVQRSTNALTVLP